MSSRTLAKPALEANHADPGLFQPVDLPESKPLRRKKEPASGLRAPAVHGKNFVLDTNVLIHDPHCIERFEDNHVCIPVEVLSELDRFKNEQTDRGASARVVHRILTEVFETCPDAITKGVPTPGGGTLRLVVADPAHPTARQRLARFYRVFPNESQVDHRILACTLLISEENASPTILVTKDLNMQLKGRAIGLICEDYKNDKVKPSEVLSTGVPLIDVCPTELQRFASTGIIELELNRLPQLVTNEYVLLRG